MAVNCLAHVLNLAAKALLLSLAFQQDNNDVSEDVGNDALPVSSNDNMEELPHEGKETVSKV